MLLNVVNVTNFCCFVTLYLLCSFGVMKCKIYRYILTLYLLLESLSYMPYLACLAYLVYLE